MDVILGLARPKRDVHKASQASLSEQPVWLFYCTYDFQMLFSRALTQFQEHLNDLQHGVK